jgi:tellurite resistance protein TerC
MGINFWIYFNILVAALLLLDLFVLNRKSQKINVKCSLWLSLFWASLAFAFNVLVFFWMGKKEALEFTTGYLVELSLSVDNLFVFLVIFSYFKVPEEYQHNVLTWGIIGAVVMRIAFILAGVALINRFEFITYILGAFLLLIAIKMLRQKEEDINPGESTVLKIAKKIFPVTSDYKGSRFFIHENGKRYATPLFLVLLAIETTDVVFAMDSIPAILAITKNAFIVYTSNIFAILGLRSLYFALAGVMKLFHFLNYGLSLILAFIGVKILLSHWVEIDTLLSLSVVVSVLIISVLASLLFKKGT